MDLYIDSLIARLGDKDNNVRGAAAEELGSLGDARADEAVNILIDMVGEDAYDANSQVITALRPLGLLACRSARALSWLGERLAVGTFDRDPSPLVALLETLGDTRGSQALVPILAILGGNFLLAEECETALRRLGVWAVEPLVVALGHDDDYVVIGAMAALCRLGGPAVIDSVVAHLDRITYSIRELTWDYESHLLVGDKLAGLGPDAVAPMAMWLENSAHDAWAKFIVARAMGQIGGVRAIEPLALMCRADDDLVRDEAARALARVAGEVDDSDFRNPYGADDVLQLLLSIEPGTELEVETALRALDLFSVEALAAFLRDTDNREKPRQSAAMFLAKVGDLRAVEPLIDTLIDEEEDEDLARACFWALFTLGDICAIAPIIAQLDWAAVSEADRRKVPVLLARFGTDAMDR